MTEIEATAAVSATPLAEHLSASGLASSQVLVPRFGSLTVQRLDAAEAETGALLLGAAVHDLGWLRRIAVRGEDRFRWLSGMVTNSVETLADSTGAYNLVLNAQGRIQGDCFVWRDVEALELEVTADQADALLAHLDRFIIMDDVELVPLPDLSALGVTGPQAQTILAGLGLPVLQDCLTSSKGSVAGTSVTVRRGYGTLTPHYELWASEGEIPKLWERLATAGATPVGAESLETLRIAEGIPAYGIDLQSRDLPQETSQDRAISFTKGCYLGQEIVERIRSRGQVHRHLRALELFPALSGQLPSAGAELRFGIEDKPAGTLTSVARLHLKSVERIFALGMIRAEAEAGSRPLAYPGGTAQILLTPPIWKDGPSAAKETV